MVYRGRGNPRARGFNRPFRARGRGRRPFNHHGGSRGARGFGRGGHQDEGLRITLRNTGRDRHEEEYGQRSLSRERERHDKRDSYADYKDDYGGERSPGYGEEVGRTIDTPPRKHLESDASEGIREESLRITVGNDRYGEELPTREGRWQEERREGQSYDRGAEEDRRSGHYRDEAYDGGRREWDESHRGRGRGYFSRGYDPNFRGRGRGDFRGRGRGGYDPERGRGRGFYSNYSRGRGGAMDWGDHPRDRRSFDDDYDRHGQRRRNLSPDRKRSRSRGRYSRSPDRRRSRSYSRGRRSLSLDRRSWGRRSRSRDRRSYSRSRRSRSRDRRSRSGSSYSGSRRGYSRSRSHSRSHSRSSSQGSYSRSRTPSPVRRRLSPSPIRRGFSPAPGQTELNQRRSMGRDMAMPTDAVHMAGERGPLHSGSQDPGFMKSQSLGREPRQDVRSQSQGRDHRSQSRGRSRYSRSNSSSSSSSSDSRSRSGQPELSEQLYEEEMYRRLKSELSLNTDPKDREERIAKHIREMAKLSPALFRQFMAKNAGNLSAMALMQPEQRPPLAAEETMSAGEADSPGSRPLRSILKRKGESLSPPPEQSPPPPPEPPSALSQIEKVIQALRKGGAKQEEKKSEKEEGIPAATGALRSLSSYMDIEEEEEYLYGDGIKREVPQKSENQPGPFWAASQFEGNLQSSSVFSSFKPQQKVVDLAPRVESPSSHQPTLNMTSGKHPLDMFEDLTSKNKKEPVKIPSAFGSFEDKEKSYEQWRASVFKKQTPEKPKEPAPQQSTASSSTGGKQSAEQLSSTVENILKSIGFNFELSQRMQELARQKKEGEQEAALMINQSASFLGSSDSDVLAEDMTSVLKKEPDSEITDVNSFLKKIQNATKIAKEKAAKAKEADERHSRGRIPNADEDTPRDRDRNYHSHRDSNSHRDRNERDGGKTEKEEPPKRTRRDSVGAGALARFDVPSTSDHSPYDPSVQDYYNRYQAQQPPPQQSYSSYDSYNQDSRVPQPVQSANLTPAQRQDSSQSWSKSLSDNRHLDFDRRDKDSSMEESSYKKAGERILIVKKKDESRSAHADSPSSDSSFSRRIVLPPKEKAKVDRTPDSDSRRDGRKRGASPVSPRRSKQSRKSPSAEDRSSERIIFQRGKNARQAESSKTESSQDQGKSSSPERVVFENKYKFQVSKSDREPSKSAPGKTDFLKSKVREELPKADSKSEQLKAEVERASKIAQDKFRLLERKKKLVALERELAALRKQHNELLRKRRRQKDGHKDPLLTENTMLQEEILGKIKALREGKDVSITDSSAKSSFISSSTLCKKSESSDSEKKAEEEKETQKVHFEYFDSGSHWCSTCNLMCGHMFDLFKHLETKKHQQKLDPFNRPWMLETMQKAEKKPKPQGPVQAHPIKGLEFMMATAAFYCSLCSEFCGDLSIAESHVKSEEHHEKYREYLAQHPYYEKRYMLERSAALTTVKRASPDPDEDNSEDSDSGKKVSEAKKKLAAKSVNKDSPKEKKSEDWKEKLHSKKTLYSDFEEDSQPDTKEKDKQKPGWGSTDRGKNSRQRGDFKDGEEDLKTRKDSRDVKEPKEGSKRDTKENKNSETSYSVRETEPAVKISDPSDVEERDGETTPEAEARKDGGEAKREWEGDYRAKIPIKLTGKSGIKPAAASLPPWKVFTRPIPKLTMQKRLLASRSQPSSSGGGPGPSLPNEDPVPLEDFLTVGSKATTPVPIMPEISQIPYPVDPKSAKTEEIDEKKKQELEEMALLGIDPSSLTPDVTPRPPPPPSQNLSMPPGRIILSASTYDIYAKADEKSGNTSSSSSSDGSKVTTTQNAKDKSGPGSGCDKDDGNVTSMDIDETEENSPVVALPPTYPPAISAPAAVPSTHPMAVVAPLPHSVQPEMLYPGHESMYPIPNTLMPPPCFAMPYGGMPFVPPMVDTSFPPPGMVPLPPVPGMAPLPPGPPPPLPEEPAPPPPPKEPVPPPLPEKETTEHPVPKELHAIPQESTAPPQEPAAPPQEPTAPPQEPTVSPQKLDAPPSLSEETSDSVSQEPATAETEQGPCVSESLQAGQSPEAASHTSTETEPSSAEPCMLESESLGPSEEVQQEELGETPVKAQKSVAGRKAITTTAKRRLTRAALAKAARAKRAAKSAKKQPPSVTESDESSVSDTLHSAELAEAVECESSSLVTDSPETVTTAEPQPSTSGEEMVSQQVVVSSELTLAMSTQELEAENPNTQVSLATSTQMALATSTQMALATSTQAAPAATTEIAMATTTSTLSSPSGKLPSSQRLRTTRKTSPVPLPSASVEDEPTEPECGEGGDDPMARRPRTRSQARPQPQRQTRSRTRQRKTAEEESDVTASDESSCVTAAEEAASSMPQDAESIDGNKASSTSACILDLTSPPGDSNEGSEASTEVSSSCNAVAVSVMTSVSPPCADSALNLTMPPGEREARQGHQREQMVPEDLSSYAEPHDLSSDKGKGHRQPEMPMDLTVPLARIQSASSVSGVAEEVSQLVEAAPLSSNTNSPISSSEGLHRVGSMEPQTMKDTLLSSTSAMNPSTSNLADLDVGDDGGLVENAPSEQVADSPSTGVDPQGDLVDFSLAPVDFEELNDMEVEESSTAAPAAAADDAECGDIVDSTFTSE